eukprot:3266927-Pyramimonas_sp.AAC.1
MDLHIDTAKRIYELAERKGRHEPGSDSWKRFAATVVEQIQSTKPDFVLTPVIAAKSKRLQPRTEGELIAGGNRLPTPPAPPSGPAVAVSVPKPPPGPARAETTPMQGGQMMVYSGAVAAMHAAPHEAAESSPTKDVQSSSDEAAAPAAKATPPVVAPSGHDVAEPSPADRTPGVPDTP